MKRHILTAVLLTTADISLAQGMHPDLRDGEMGYRLACSIHELANTGFSCPEYQETKDLIERLKVKSYWPEQYDFQNQFLPPQLDSFRGGNEVEFPLGFHNLMPEDTIRRGFELERQVLAADPKSVRAIDALVSLNPRNGIRLVEDLKSKLQSRGYEQGDSDLITFLSSVPNEEIRATMELALNDTLEADAEIHLGSLEGLDLFSSFEDKSLGPVAAHRFFVPFGSLESQTISRLRMAAGEYQSLLLEDREFSRELGLRMAVLERISKGSKVSEAEVSLLPYRSQTGFLLEDVDAVFPNLTFSELSKNSIRSGFDILVAAAEELVADVELAGFSELADELAESLQRAKSAATSTSDQAELKDLELRITAEFQNAQERLQAFSVREAGRSGEWIKEWRVDQVVDDSGNAALRKTDNDVIVEIDKIGSVDILSGKRTEWALGLKLSNQFATIFRDVAVIVGDDDAAMRFGNISRDIQLTAQALDGLSQIGDAFSMSEEELGAQAIAMASGIGTVVAVGAAIANIQKSKAEAENARKTQELLIAIYKLQVETLKQVRENERLIRALGFELAEAERRLTAQFDRATNRLTVVRKDLHEFRGYFEDVAEKNAARDADALLWDRLKVQEIGGKLLQGESLGPDLVAQTAYFMLTFMPKEPFQHPTLGDLSPAPISISDFSDLGSYGVSWNALKNPDLSGDNLADPNVRSASLATLFAEGAPLEKAFDLQEVAEGFSNAVYPDALVQPMRVLGDLMLYASPSNDLKISKELVDQRVADFLEAQKTLASTLPHAVMAKLRAYHNLEQALSDVSMAAATGAYNSFGRYESQNAYIDTLRNRESAELLFDSLLASADLGRFGQETNGRTDRQQLKSDLGNRLSHTLTYFVDAGEQGRSYNVIGRAVEAGLVEWRDLDPSVDEIREVPRFKDDEGNIYVHDQGFVRISFRGYEIRKYGSFMGGPGKTEAWGATAGASLWYERSLAYKDIRVSSADGFDESAVSGVFKIADSVRSPEYGILAYDLLDVTADIFTDGTGAAELANRENNRFAAAHFEEAKEHMTKVEELLARILAEESEQLQSEMGGLFETIVSAARDGTLVEQSGSIVNHRLFNDFRAVNRWIDYGDVTEITTDPVTGETIEKKGDWNSLFEDGGGFILDRLLLIDRSMREIEALNWYIDYAGTVSFGSCLGSGEEFSFGLSYPLPLIIRNAENDIKDEAVIFYALPRVLREEIEKYQKALPLVEDYVLKPKICDTTHGVYPAWRRLNERYTNLGNYIIASEMGTLFPMSETRSLFLEAAEQ